MTESALGGFQSTGREAKVAWCPILRNAKGGGPPALRNVSWIVNPSPTLALRARMGHRRLAGKDEAPALGVRRLAPAALTKAYASGRKCYGPGVVRRSYSTSQQRAKSVKL